MNAIEFRSAMEAFARARNIPLNDVLHDIEEVGMYAMQRPEAERSPFFQRAFTIYCEGFPVALPVGTKSIRRREEDSSN
jgi:hypothetical protein